MIEHPEAGLQTPDSKEGAAVPEFPTVCLVGSTKFMDDFRAEAARLTLEGYIVLAPFVVTSEQVTETPPETKEMLNRMHFRKIDMAASVHVINPGGYVGDATRAEIDYCHQSGKPLTWMESSQLCCGQVAQTGGGMFIAYCNKCGWEDTRSTIEGATETALAHG